MKHFEINSKRDNLKLKGVIFEPKNNAKAIIQISHGMAEHKERYFKFMKFLSNAGYVVIIHDHRGHGESVNSFNELGYFGDGQDILVEELYEVTKYVRNKYKGLDVILFGHSMGSLVARGYIQKYDKDISKLVLCGVPTYNPLSNVGVLISNIIKIFKGEKYRSKFINNLVFGNYNKGYEKENSWLCSNINIVNDYNKDKYCGFVFTINGFQMLFYLMKLVFNKNKYKCKNKNLSIFIIGGLDDPVIGGFNKFNHLVNFIKEVGYLNVQSKLYEEMRHELLNEINNKNVYEDILNFIEKSQ